MPTKLEKVELFAVGKWNGLEFTIEDLRSMAVAFDALGDNHRVPLKFGHNEEQPMTDGQPALGRVESVWVEDEKLFGAFNNVPQIVADAVTANLYDKVSIELDMGVEYKGNHFPWVLSGVALLGADIPAVNTLSDLSAYMTTDGAYHREKRVGFTRHNPRRKEFSMPKTIEELQAELDAANAKIAASDADKAKFARENEELRKQQEKREAADKKAKFAAAKTEITADLDALVKDNKIDPAKREKILAEFAEDDAAISKLKYTVDILKDVTGAGSNLPQGEGAGQGKGEEGTPDLVVRSRALKYSRESGGKVTYNQAVQHVLAEDTKLAREYVDMNGGN